jgi:4-amino-4-deoxy-L-arabinose transferase-like glycosyltransferase
MTFNNIKKSGKYGPAVLLVLGVILIGFAWLIDNGEIERALVSNPSRALEWGPSLFRALLGTHGLALVLAGAVWRRRLSGGARLPVDAARAERDYSARASKTPWLILCGLSLLALCLRIWHLNSGLWFDEVLTLVDFVRSPLGDSISSFPSQNQHMLFTLLAQASISIFGESAWALRLPSVVFGVASLWSLFLLGRHVVGARTALLSCALMTVSYHHIWFSQNARGYMGLLFFATLATWLWLEALSRNSWPWWTYYVAAVCLGMWVNLTMAFVAATHAILYLIWLASKLRSRQPQTGSGHLWKPLVALLLCGSLTLQLYALSLPEFLSTALHEISLESEWTNPLWVITESLRSLKVGFAGTAIVLCGGAMVMAGWISILRRNYQAGLAMTLPGLLAGTSMLVLGHNLWPRFFFFCMGFALLIAVEGAIVAPQKLFSLIKPLRAREGLAGATGLALASFMILASSITIARYYALPKQDFTGARDFVEQNRAQSDAVVAVGLAGTAYGRYFAPHWSVAQTQKELDEIRRDRSTVWLVYTIPVQVKAYCPDIWQVIESDFSVVNVFPGTLGGGEVYVCRERAGATATRLSLATQD